MDIPASINQTAASETAFQEDGELEHDIDMCMGDSEPSDEDEDAMIFYQFIADMARGGGNIRSTGSRHSGGQYRLVDEPEILTEVASRPTAPMAYSAPAQCDPATIRHVSAPNRNNPTVHEPVQSRTTISHAEPSNQSRIHVTLDEKSRLCPSGSCSRRIRKIFEEHIEKEGYKWKTVPKDTKKFCFLEFEKHFFWDPAIHAAVESAFYQKASIRYANMLSDIRSNTNKPRFVPEETWKYWQEKWNEPNAIHVSQQASKNRRSQSEGDGPSCHTGGSLTHSEHKRRLTILLGHSPTKYEMFLHTHTKEHDGKSFIDEKSKAFNDKFVALKEQMLQTNETLDDSEVYLIAAGGQVKNRVYGLGSEATQNHSGNSSSATSENDVVLQKKVEELQEKLDTMEEQMGHRVQQQVQQEVQQQVQQHHQGLLLQVQQQQQLISQMQSQLNVILQQQLQQVHTSRHQ